MNLETLKVRNFCGIKSFDLSLSGGHADIYGDNATGKTTIANAFLWLLTGKNITGTADLDPQPLDADNQPIHNLETEVEAVLDGTIYRRVLAETWQKRRGSAETELTGTKTSYFINSVPQKENEYKSAVEANICKADVLKMLCISSYFAAAMDWKERRRVLLELAGDVEDSDVINATAELAELPAILGEHTVDDYLKIAKSRKGEIKKELDSIPARITENENAIPAELADMSQLTERLAASETEKTRLETEIAADDGEVEKLNAINSVKLKIAEARKNFIVKENDRVYKISHDFNALHAKRDEVFSQRSRLIVRSEALPREIERTEKQRAALLDEYNKTKESAYTGSDICPCCGQKLPEEKVAEALATFNKKKSDDLANINARGKECSSDVIAKLKSELSALAAPIADMTEQLKALDTEIEEKKTDNKCRNYEDTDDYKALSEELSAAEAVEVTSNNVERETRIAELKAVIFEINAEIGKHTAAEHSKARIEELEKQQRELGAALVECEKGEYLCEQFIRAKVGMLDERINSRFKTLKFKLFHQQQNGGLAEICKVLIPCESGLVEYDKANNAAKINAGLEIIETLSAHYGVSLPVFVDNAESVTALNEISNQTIRLIVSEQDKSLRIEA